MDLQAIKQLAFELMGNRRSHVGKEKGNKYYHGERVANLIIKLRKHILPNDDSHDEILTAAAWFHDISNGSDDHGKEGAKKTREVLAKYCSDYEIEEICKIISVHDDRSSKCDLYSDYIRLHQDADHLDHFGTFDIWMQFIYAIQHDHSFDEIIHWFRNTRREEAKHYREELNFEISKKIFDEKNQFVMYFGERLGVEGTGGIWNEDEIARYM